MFQWLPHFPVLQRSWELRLKYANCFLLELSTHVAFQQSQHKDHRHCPRQVQPHPAHLIEFDFQFQLQLESLSELFS